MIIFFEDMEIVKSIPAMIASYLASLLEAGKSKRMACSIISPIGALSCNPRQLLSVMKRHPHSESTSQSCLVPFLVEGFSLKSQPVLAPLTPSEVFIGYQTLSIQLPTEPFVMTS